MRLHASGIVILVLLSAGCRATAPNEYGRATFQRLTSLVGNWEGTLPDGRKHFVAYRMSAANSALVETWTLGPGRESITIYHMDGDALLATHFCPQGNQPRMQLVANGEAGRLTFEFRDGTNLSVSGRSHQQSFWLELTGPDTLVRSETYVENDSSKSDPGDAITYRRVK